MRERKTPGCLGLRIRLGVYLPSGSNLTSTSVLLLNGWASVEPGSPSGTAQHPHPRGILRVCFLPGPGSQQASCPPSCPWCADVAFRSVKSMLAELPGYTRCLTEFLIPWRRQTGPSLTTVCDTCDENHWRDTTVTFSESQKKQRFAFLITFF